jgi:hypothetical protein
VHNRHASPAGRAGARRGLNVDIDFTKIGTVRNAIDVHERTPSLTAHQRAEAIQRLAEGATQADLARSYGVSQATISRLSPSPFGLEAGGAA